jgi:four helix bundle protein
LERRNINRGFKQLRVWQDAIELYLLAMKIFPKFPFEMKGTASNAVDAAHSISRNMAEGYCRRSLKEYLNHLNIALGSCGEFHSCYYSFYKANMISKEDFESLDALHYKVLTCPTFFTGHRGKDLLTCMRDYPWPKIQ